VIGKHVDRQRCAYRIFGHGQPRNPSTLQQAEIGLIRALRTSGIAFGAGRMWSVEDKVWSVGSDGRKTSRFC
jgi:hypothetical protein